MLSRLTNYYIDILSVNCYIGQKFKIYNVECFRGRQDIENLNKHYVLLHCSLLIRSLFQLLWYITIS